MRTISSPVANGSSVPAWPTLPPLSRLTSATTSWDVIPAGLSTSSPRAGVGSPPFIERSGLELGLDLPDQELHDLLVGEIGAEPRRAAMATAAVDPGDGRDVDPPIGGAHAHLAGLATALGLVAHDGSGRGSVDGAQMVDDPFRQRLAGAGVRVVPVGDVGDREPPVVTQLDALQ